MGESKTVWRIRKGAGLAEADGDGEGVRGVDPRQAPQGVHAAGVVRQHLFVGVLDVGAGEVPAVVPLDAGAQLEAVGRPSGETGPGGGQGGLGDGRRPGIPARPGRRRSWPRCRWGWLVVVATLRVVGSPSVTMTAVPPAGCPGRRRVRPAGRRRGAGGRRPRPAPAQSAQGSPSRQTQARPVARAPPRERRRSADPIPPLPLPLPPPSGGPTRPPTLSKHTGAGRELDRHGAPTVGPPGAGRLLARSGDDARLVDPGDGLRVGTGEEGHPILAAGAEDPLPGLGHLGGYGSRGIWR